MRISVVVVVVVVVLNKSFSVVEMNSILITTASFTRR